ncbi:Olfactory Receptor 8S1 [Manis pentadactyla]|nr:Olfactory Receptor 8S1 [Manis pentadactyla]
MPELHEREGTGRAAPPAPARSHTGPRAPLPPRLALPARPEAAGAAPCPRRAHPAPCPAARRSRVAGPRPNAGLWEVRGLDSRRCRRRSW